MTSQYSDALQNMSEAIEAEKEAKRQLAQRVAYLEAELGPDHTVRETELERLLQQVICSRIGRRLELKKSNLLPALFETSSTSSESVSIFARWRKPVLCIIEWS